MWAANDEEPKDAVNVCLHMQLKEIFRDDIRKFTG
jgi:hypothetical protein